MKQCIDDEVRQQLDEELDEERTEGQNPSAVAGVPDFLTVNTSHVFVVSSNLYSTTPDGGECAVTGGDVLWMPARILPPPPGTPAAKVMVLASKGMDCRRGTMVTVGITDLADARKTRHASAK